jgi:hypothetical protein
VVREVEAGWELVRGVGCLAVSVDEEVVGQDFIWRPQELDWLLVHIHLL